MYFIYGYIQIKSGKTSKKYKTVENIYKKSRLFISIYRTWLSILMKSALFSNKLILIIWFPFINASRLINLLHNCLILYNNKYILDYLVLCLHLGLLEWKKIRVLSREYIFSSVPFPTSGCRVDKNPVK